jgi:hypothetical protein
MIRTITLADALLAPTAAAAQQQRMPPELVGEKSHP